MEPTDILRLVHPAIAVTFILPLIGIVSYFAWQTRQRRLQSQAGVKSKIPAVVGPDHAKLGRILTSGVVGIALLGLFHPIAKTLIKNQVWVDQPLRLVFVILIFLATIASLIFLYQAKPNQRNWRGLFGGLTGAGVLILGSQEGVFRRTNEWYASHFYFGMAVTLLMIFSLAILPEIYKNKKWRQLHAVLNTLAVLLFIAQGMTGVRDLLEIPLSWQEPFIYQCDFVNKTCADPRQSQQDDPSRWLQALRDENH
ncbi:MAG: DUF4079 domain-containing protein [Synechococcaceae cyanobacterium SM2_3_1]|nr:DUF4079 domain-containing protein [Synechococcaceae cyanobacterium SM2_3_1]